MELPGYTLTRYQAEVITFQAATRGAALTNRNRVAREKLEAILASASPSLTLSARQTPFGITHVIERSR